MVRRGRVQSFVPALLVLVAGVLVVDAITTFIVLTLVAHGEIMTDWLSFYTSGFLTRTGDAAQLYDTTVQASTQFELFGGIPPMGYPLPAFAAGLFAPLSSLSFAQSYFAWLAINVALLAVLVVAGWGWLSPTPKTLRLAFLGGSATIAFVIVVLNAQVDLFVVTGLISCYALLRSDRPFTAGAVLALALFKPHLAGGVVLLLLLTRQWRALAGFATVGIPLLTLPALLMAGPRLFIDQISLLVSYTSTGTDYRVNAESMINIRGPITALTGSSSVWVWLPLFALIAGVAIFVAVSIWRERPALHPQSWALAFALPLLYSPHVHFQTIVLLLAAAGLYLVADQSTRTPRVTLEHLLLGFVAINALWLLTIAGFPLMAFYVMASYTVLARRWSDVATAAERPLPQSLAA
jgi:hypothetical protein